MIEDYYTLDTGYDKQRHTVQKSDIHTRVSNIAGEVSADIWVFIVNVCKVSRKSTGCVSGHGR